LVIYVTAATVFKKTVIRELKIPTNTKENTYAASFVITIVPVKGANAA
jgi:hypothetical protein